MKRHKKVLFDQIKEEDQGKRKKRSSTIYYFATEAFFEYLKDRADYSRFPCFIRDGVGNRHSDQ